MNFKTKIENGFLIIEPSDKLTDKEYDELKPYIETMGGHWREKVGGFVFKLNYLRRNELAQLQEDIQFFPTPKSVADRVVELAGLKNFDMSKFDYDDISTYPFILEPSAGQGALIEAVDKTIRRFQREYVIEPHEENALVLEELGHRVERTSFEKFYKEHKNDKKEISHVIMNPPFSLGRDIKHTRMAYDLLKKGGVLVSVISENSLYYKNNENLEFKQWLTDIDAYIEDLPYGSFIESGTSVDTVIIKIIKK